MLNYTLVFFSGPAGIIQTVKKKVFSTIFVAVQSLKTNSKYLSGFGSKDHSQHLYLLEFSVENVDCDVFVSTRQ